jgi:DNA gyrase/topoisomerase IV subunit B
LDLSKQASELLASRLKEKNLLEPDVKVTFYREREKELLSYFIEEDNLVFCNDIENLLIKMG